MKLKAIGTIYASNEQLAVADAFANKQAARINRTGNRLFPDYDRRVIGGEVRYYQSEAKFAILNRAGKVLWFEVRGEQTFSVKE